MIEEHHDKVPLVRIKKEDEEIHNLTILTIFRSTTFLFGLRMQAEQKGYILVNKIWLRETNVRAIQNS